MYKLMIGDRTILDNTRTGYVGYEPQSSNVLKYLTYLPITSSYADSPVVNQLNVTWSNMTNSSCSTQTISSSEINGTMPSTYIGTTTLRTKGSPNGKLDLRSLSEFTLGFWIRAITSISGAGQFFECRLHQSMSMPLIHLDGSNVKSYIQSSTVTMYSSTTVEGTCVWRINDASKNAWSYMQYYINRPDKVIEFYCNGTLVLAITNCVNDLIDSGSLDTGIDSIFRIYNDSSSYGNLNIAELAIYTGKKIGVPTQPINS